jgi:hypothetical protein
MTNLKDEIKVFLRIKTSDSGIDAEIEGLMNACEKDMILSGVDKRVASWKGHPLTIQAQKFYAKAYFGNGDESGRFQRAYEALRDRMALGGGQI